jgi:hypothetical protein
LAAAVEGFDAVLPGIAVCAGTKEALANIIRIASVSEVVSFILWALSALRRAVTDQHA